MAFADFGVAFIDFNPWQPWDEVRSYDLFGTPAYLAPEMIADNMSVVGYTAAVDIFSLGLVFLELMGRLTDAYWPATTTHHQARLMEIQPLSLETLVEDGCARDLLYRVRSHHVHIEF